MPELSVAYTLCDTVSSASVAMEILSRSRYLILDCEGRNIGDSEGALSLISIGTQGAGHIFLFDAVMLAQQHPPMESLLRLLGDPHIGKIMWDGRRDFLEMWENYGTALHGVLDLQVAEVASRGAYRGEKTRHRKTRLAKSQFGRKDILPQVKQCPDIHLLIGMQTCLDENKLGAGVKKDGEKPCKRQLPHRVNYEYSQLK
jgi:exonuclease 3'-5' domain-containing protein 1